jgi:hypothetical protein
MFGDLESRLRPCAQETDKGVRPAAASWSRSSILQSTPGDAKSSAIRGNEGVTASTRGPRVQRLAPPLGGGLAQPEAEGGGGVGAPPLLDVGEGEGQLQPRRGAPPAAAYTDAVEHLETRAGERRSGRSFRRRAVEDSHARAASGLRPAGRSTADDSLPGRCRSDELEAAGAPPAADRARGRDTGARFEQLPRPCLLRRRRGGGPPAAVTPA